MLQMVGGQGHGRIGMTHGPCDWLFCQHNHSLAHEPVCGTHARCTPTTPTDLPFTSSSMSSDMRTQELRPPRDAPGYHTGAAPAPNGPW